MSHNVGKNNPKYSHGMYGTSIYSTWVSLKGRCLNPNNKAYKNYGGRGIGLCKKWQTFEGFYQDMGDRPGPKYSIDRIDNNGNYEKSNCKWSTSKEQNNNRRSTILLTFDKRTMSIKQWAAAMNISPYTLYYRKRNNWPTHLILKEWCGIIVEGKGN